MTPSPSIRFLVVEDDDAHAAITIRSLNGQAAAIERVADGVEAIAYLRRQGQYADKPRPDVILLDLNLPRMNGHEVLQSLKEDPDLRTIPIVVLTTSDAATDRSRAYRGHANSYLVKPMDFVCFRQLVHSLCSYWGGVNRLAEPGNPCEGALNAG